MKHILYFLLFTVNLNAQTTEVKRLLDNLYTSTIQVDSLRTMTLQENVKTSDTTEVIYVLLREDYIEEYNDTINLIPVPYMDVIYGYHVQHRKPYKVEFYDSLWNPIKEEDLLYIKKRKLFKR